MRIALSLMCLLISLNAFSEAGLNGVSCDPMTGRNCVAVGWASQDNKEHPLVYFTENRGKKWTQAAIVMPTSIYSCLNQISCDHAKRYCSAVGIDGDETHQIAYYSKDMGKTWLPSTIALDPQWHQWLTDISCSKINQNCVAVGTVRDLLTTKTLTFISSDYGQNWLHSKENFFVEKKSPESLGVACDEYNSHCVMVGNIQIGDETTPFTYLSENGGFDWALNYKQPSLPDDANLFYLYGLNKLKTVKCDDYAQNCVAVGEYMTNNHSTLPLSYTTFDGGRTWTLSKFPEKNSKSSKAVEKLIDVSCSQRMDRCIAVGSVNNEQDLFVPLILISGDGGQSWTAAPSISLPKDAETKLNDLNDELLKGISCDESGTFCMVVGEYTTKNSKHSPLIYYTTDGGISWELRNNLQ